MVDWQQSMKQSILRIGVHIVQHSSPNSPTQHFPSKLIQLIIKPAHHMPTLLNPPYHMFPSSPSASKPSVGIQHKGLPLTQHNPNPRKYLQVKCQCLPISPSHWHMNAMRAASPSHLLTFHTGKPRSLPSPYILGFLRPARQIDIDI